MLLAALANFQHHSFGTLLGVATLGNTLGGMSTWLLGWMLAVRYPLDQPHKASRERAIRHLKKYGSSLLLLSWLPIVGDPLCFAAGWLRMNPWLSALFIGVGKAARYAVILFLM
jgi:membrane protein YqaA with SNARE-associated domain